MKKRICSIIVVCLCFVTCLGCNPSTLFRKEVQITTSNFYEYFDIYTDVESFEGTDVDSFSGIPFLTEASCKVMITISPKVAISGGSVNVVLDDDYVGVWDCEYFYATMTVDGISSGGLNVPIQFSPVQQYTKTFEMTSFGEFYEPSIDWVIKEASGTIII